MSIYSEFVEGGPGEPEVLEALDVVVPGGVVDGHEARTRHRVEVSSSVIEELQTIRHVLNR